MTDKQLLHLRQRVDRDDSLTTSARLLFGEIINLNVMGDGCYKQYTTLASDLGMNERTVRRRRKELEAAGYLTVSHDGDRRYLVPTTPDTHDRTGHECPDTDDKSDTSGRTQMSAPDTNDETPPDTGVQDREIDNPEGGSSRARAREDRWEFLPDYRMRHLPEIKQEASSPDDAVDVLGIASRYLGRPQDDLAGTVDWHLDQLPEDEVIAAYVIAGREADSPPEYADKIIREGWKEPAGGDGVSPQLPDSDENVIHFGNA